MKMSRKISVRTADKIIRNAKNRGEQREGQTIKELPVVEWNPYLNGKLGGDVVLKNGIKIQVKAFDGQVPGEITGNLEYDIIKAIEEDASDVWVIWFSEKEYLIIEKNKLIEKMRKFADDLVRYNKRDGKTVLRLKMGPQKKKIFFGMDIRVAK